MSRSSLVRPLARQCLGNFGPLVLYSTLAIISAWGAGRSGWPSVGGFWGAWFAWFFGTIVYQELRCCVTLARAVRQR